MIYSLIYRRLCLWRNRIVPSIFFFLILPVTAFILINLPLKNIIRYSLTGEPYDIWVLPGLTFILGSISIFPIIYREFFILRIDRKVLINIALTPFSKTNIIFSSLITSILESYITIVSGILVFNIFIPNNLQITNLLYLFSCLTLYLFLLGNLYLTLSLIIDALTTILLTIFALLLYILFGCGFLIELSFFPLSVEFILKLIPLSVPFQIYQKFNSTTIIDWFSILSMIFIIYIWVLFNARLLKYKLKQ